MRALADPWVQTFGFLAVASGALAAYGRLVPAGGTAAPSAAPAAAAPSAHGRRVIVDARLARDADTADLSAALSVMAHSGDTVYVRAGTYRGPLRPVNGLKIVGVGAPSAIVIEGPSDKPAIWAEGITLSVSSVSLRGGAPSVWASGGAQVRLSGVSVETAFSGVVAAGAGTKVTLDGSRVLRSGGDGVHARDRAALEIARSELLGHKGCGLSLQQGASARLSASTLSLNDYGVCADASSTVDLGDSDLSGNIHGKQIVRDAAPAATN